MEFEPNSSPTLVTLPYELVVKIISNSQFYREDWKGFRLLCRAFEQPASSLLFRTVTISRLLEDRDKFEQIATHPHLAQHVRQVIWHELNLEAWRYPEEDETLRFDQGYLDRLAKFEGSDGMELESITRLMLDAVHDPELFWWPRISHDLIGGAEKRRCIISDFFFRFVAAIDRMPKLTAFRSSPMPVDRVFSYRGYPLQADLYRLWGGRIFYSGNEGFHNFMLPMMSRVKSKIASLHWADETIWTSLASNMKPVYSQAFSALMSIDLCVSGLDDGDRVSIPALLLCLNAATKLEHFSLCLERAEPSTQRRLTDAIFSDCHWPRLSSLRLVNVWLRNSRLSQFCKNHSERLRHLTFNSCEVLTTDIFAANDVSDFNLESITISSPSRAFMNVFKENLFEFINGESSNEVDIRGDDVLNDLDDRSVRSISGFDEIYVRTTYSKYDYHAWCMAGYYDLDAAYCEHTSDEAEKMELCLEDDEDGGEFKDSQPKTYWAWDRFSSTLSGDVFYWRADENPDQAQARTTYWRFTSRDGTTAVGKDPLDYFAEWDSDEGDIATPTPFCKKLFGFDASGDIIRKPPAGAMSYSRFSDPMNGSYYDYYDPPD
ncbi:hypothetical protein F4776DRAFT_307247 [Hypoxylon sp. NC0597]|nr:hypothetical protein F4776DRAFT_307247 [Hypoxylon sp. NC0597]